jgi:hypothetical protein
LLNFNLTPILNSCLPTEKPDQYRHLDTNYTQRHSIARPYSNSSRYDNHLLILAVTSELIFVTRAPTATFTRQLCSIDNGTADQHSTVKTATQMTPEGDSRVLASATSSSIDTTMAPGTGYFNFLGLPRELRDMIYDQFQRLHPDTPSFLKAGRPAPMVSHTVNTKPITPLLLVNKQIGSEYRDACEERSGVIVSTYMEYLV